MDVSFNAVVMAGGVGSRLWPLSRASFPKQYQQLVDNKHGYTMLQQTFSRLSGLSIGSSQIICNQDHRFLAAEQCRDAQIVLEPMGRNTAPAVILAALRLLEAGTDEPMLVLSADHAIADETSFRSALVSAHKLAVLGNLVTLDIEPSFACIGYGYIRYRDDVSAVFEVDGFVEKPDEATAQSYLKQGNYLWNSGMFIVRPSVLIEEAALYCAQLLHHCRLTGKSATKDLDFIRLPEHEFSQCEDISLDYAIMEYTQKAVVVPVDCGWSDVGDFQALWKTNKKNGEGNVLQGDAVALDSQNCLVKAQNRLVAILGVEGLAVIETKDAVLVAPLDQTQKVKDMVALLQGRGELTSQREVQSGNYLGEDDIERLEDLYGRC
jgi:mannose-1-phosphate guanylyltransferase